ncbi:MAG: hypothetical protein R3330_15775, partial [Saprospiraceae bacterium]|nr:hypothetical protein [Saprospiraceae bacterium]
MSSASHHILVGTISTTVQVSGSDHDAEENVSTGSVNFTSTDLELCTESSTPQVVGMRFANPGIPKSSLILAAYLQFTVDETNNANPCSLMIWGEDAGNAAPYTTADFNISSRSKTSTSVAWEPPEWVAVDDAGPDQTTPDLAGIVQEILGHPGYIPSGALALIIEGSGRRVAESFNGESNQAPVLVVEYQPCPAAGEACDDGDPATTNDQQDGFCNCVGTPYSGSADIQIVAGNDDVEQNGNNGSLYFNSSDIELVHDGTRGDQIIGLRFRNLNLPQGSFIQHAYLQFTVDEVDGGDNLVTVAGEDADDAAPFISEVNNVSDRSATEAQRDWTIPPWSVIGASGLEQRTPELRMIAGEIIGRPGWAPGNDIVFMISGTGSKTAESYDGSPTDAAVLHIEWDSVCTLDHVIHVDADAN